MPYVMTRRTRYNRRPRGMGDESTDPFGNVTYVPDQSSIGDLLGNQIQPIPAGAVLTGAGDNPQISSPFNWTGLLNSITGAAQVGNKIYLSTQTPSLVPGTNAIYNASTGQYYNPTTGQVVNAPGTPGTTSTLFPAGISTANMGSWLLYGGLAIAGILAVKMMSGK